MIDPVGRRPHVDSGGPPPDDVDEIRLRDGSRIWVRAIRPEDRDKLEEGLRWLSPRSRYMRFHTQVERLTKSQLDYLVDVDHHDHDALVALDPDIERQPGVAVARYIRLRDETSIAEAAITVVDSHQGKGIGTTMIGLLEALAHERGIRVFRNYVLAENTAMLEIFRQLDGELVRESPGLFRVDVPVPGPDDGQPDTPAGRWVSSIGRHAVQEEDQQEAWAYPLVWLLRLLGSDVRPASDPSESSLLKRWVAQEHRADAEVATDDEVAADADPEGPASMG